MSFDSILSNVHNYMSANNMIVDNEWLSECVSYLFENDHTVDEIKTLTKEQWLLNNLSIVSPGCLPPNLNGHKTVLPGRYVLQINAAVDIGTPLYQQYLKLQKVNTENIEATTKYDEKVSSQRMIKLYMTDGVQEITGIEYRPMRNLSLDVTPGSKILIKGPVECRRGTLLLTENCIELLGGEVEELITSNSQSGILSSKLNLQVQQPPTSLTTAHPPMNHINRNIPSPHMPITPETTIDTHKPTTNFIEDDIDINELDAIEAQYSDSLTKRSSDDDFSNPVKKFKSETSLSNVPDDDIIFEDEEYLRELEMKFDEKEKVMQDSVSSSDVIVIDDRPQVNNVMPAEPFVYIKQINEVNEIYGMVFKVKAQILKILSKLTVAKDGWSLSCTIVDGTASMDVDFSSDALSKLIGFTPQEMIKMKKEMATNAKVKEKVSLALQRARENLQVLYCIIEITVLEKPIITKLIPFESSHVDVLRKRLQDSGL